MQPCSRAGHAGRSAVTPCSHAALQPCSRAAMQPCSRTAMQPCSCATMQTCRHATMQEMQPCSHARHAAMRLRACNTATSPSGAAMRLDSTCSSPDARPSSLFTTSPAGGACGC
eukprot:155340-Chlamydomonas_euryale.AAC.4